VKLLLIRGVLRSRIIVRMRFVINEAQLERKLTHVIPRWKIKQSFPTAAINKKFQEVEGGREGGREGEAVQISAEVTDTQKTSVRTVDLGYGLNDRGSIPGRGREFFFCSSPRADRLGAHYAAYTMGTSGSLDAGIRRPGREAHNSLLSSAKVKNVWSYTSIPRYVFMPCCLIKQWMRLHNVVLS
jgi:hypothetical protein